MTDVLTCADCGLEGHGVTYSSTFEAALCGGCHATRRDQLPRPRPPSLPDAEVDKLVTSMVRTDQRNHPERWAQRNGNGNHPTPGSFTARRLLLSNVRPVSWAWRDRVPFGTLSLLVGEEGVGKGTLLAWMIARLSCGDLPGDLFGTPADVLIIGDEDGIEDVWTPRLLAAGADLDRIRELPPSTTHGVLDVHRDADELQRIVREQGARVVVLDALLDNLPDGVDEYKPRSVRSALMPLRLLARAENLAVFGSLHTNKSGESFRQKMSGSHAFNALSRSGLLLAQHPDDDDKRVLLRGKGNLSRKPPGLEFKITGSLVEINGYRLDMPLAGDFRESEVSIEQVLGSTRGDDALALQEAVEFLETVLADEAVLSKDVQAQAAERDISTATLRRARERLGVQAFQKDRQWFMRVPREHVSISEHLRASDGQALTDASDAHPLTPSELEQVTS
jgi:hypothetical protein